MESPKTGLPFDNSEHGEFSSVSNIGMYLASICAARKLGLVAEDGANGKLDRCLTALEKLKTHFGFQQSWNSVLNLQPAKHDPWISLLDSGNLAACLLTVSQAAPKFRKRAESLYAGMEWDKFYDSKQKALLGGFSMEKHDFNHAWHLDLLASDALLCQFFAVANHGAPESYLLSLKQEREDRDGYSYLAPGWQGGGLFMQFLAGIFLDTSRTPLGPSARDFTRAQMEHAKTIGAPVWGWSACDNPAGGYLGWGSLKDDVVTPHASVLAIEMFPVEVIANLRALEKLGARSHDHGFFDSVNWRTEARSKLFLTFDQGMLLLSLANYMEDGVVRKWFHGNAGVRKGQAILDRSLLLKT